MPIPALVIDAELLPPLSEHRGRIVQLNAEDFKRRFGQCACALVAMCGSASGPDLDLVIDLRQGEPLVPLAVVTDVSPEAPRLLGRLTPDVVVTAPTTTDALFAAVDSIAALPLLERLALAIERNGYIEPSIAAAVATCCRSEEPVHTVKRMVELSGLKRSTFRDRWVKTQAISPKEFQRALELIRAAVLWDNGVLVKEIPERLGISKSTLKRRRSNRRFHSAWAERLARELLGKLAYRGQYGRNTVENDHCAGCHRIE